MKDLPHHGVKRVREKSSEFFWADFPAFTQRIFYQFSLFLYSLKVSENQWFVMLSGGIERNPWYEVVQGGNKLVLGLLRKNTYLQ